MKYFLNLLPLLKSRLVNHWEAKTNLNRWLLLYLITPLLFFLILLFFPLDKNSPSFARIKFSALSSEIGQNVNTITSTSTGMGTVSPISQFLEGKMGIPLKTNEYYFLLFNRNTIQLNGEDIVLPYKKDLEAGSMEVSLKNPDGTTLKGVYAKWGSFGLGTVRTDELLNTLPVVTFRFPTYIPLALGLVNGDASNTVPTASAYINPGSSYGIFFPSFSQLFFKYLLIAASWLAIVIALSESWKIIRK